MNNSSAPWTDDRVAELRRLWTAGASAAQIAIALNCGLSRNAVIGKARRLKLEARLAVVRPARVPKVPAPALKRDVLKLEARVGIVPQARAQKGETSMAPTTVTIVVPHLPTEGPIAATRPSKPLTITQLDAAFRKCRWIVHRDRLRAGGDLYCGAPTVHGRSWCCRHNELSCDRSTPRRPAREVVHGRAAE